MNPYGEGTMDWFFDSWVYGTGIPQYRLKYTLKPAPEKGKFVLRGIVRQLGVPASFRTPISFYFHQGNRSTRNWFAIRGPETPFEVTFPFKPDKVTINDWEDVLCTVKYD